MAISPWAGVPYNPNVAADDVQASMGIPSTATPSSIWAAPPDAGISAPAMPVVQKPKMDLHANLPPVFAPTPKPNPQDEITGHLQGQLENDYKKDADPWGSPDNHPGFLGKLVHGLSVATGGNTRRGWEEQGIAKQLNDVVGDEATNKYKGAETAKDIEETSEMPQKATDAHNLSGATTRHTNDEANALEHPTPKLEIHDTEDGPMVFNPSSGVGQHLTVDGQPIGPKITLKESQPIMGADGKPHTYMIDDKGNKKVDLGVHYERPVTTNINNGEKNLWSVPQPDGTRKAVSIRAGDVIPQGALSLSGQNSETVNSDKKGQAAEEAARNMDDELGLMKQFAAQPSPTNDAAMLMHYIGATKPESMGKIRLNENEIRLFGGTRNSLGDAEALLTKVSNGQSLTPKQRQDMINTMTAITQATHRGPSQGVNASSSPNAPQPGTIEGGYKFKGGDPAKQENWVKQ